MQTLLTQNLAIQASEIELLLPHQWYLAEPCEVSGIAQRILMREESMHNYQLRLSDIVDVADLCRISAQARLRYRAIPNLAHIAETPALPPERFEACRVVVAVNSESQKIIGFAAMRLLDGLLYLDNISVDPDASGSGIGAKLLTAVIEHAESCGFQAVSLTTFHEPPWNGPWFRKHGFRTMPSEHIAEGLKQVMDRQWLTLDATTRETLWRVL